MNSEFEAWVEAIARDMDETHPVGDLSGGPSPSSGYCAPPTFGTVCKSCHCARLRTLPNAEAISYHGLV